MSQGGGSFPYIGCKISLISKHGIRYQGTLFSIHAEDHTICLNNVRCFGTEGRRAKDNLPEVPAAADVFEYIMFRGSDIQDLTVCEANQAPQAPPPDPAIVSTNQAPASGPGGAPPAPPGVSIPAPQPVAQPRNNDNREARVRAPRKPRENHTQPRGDGSLEGTGQHLASRRAKPAENPYVQPEGEYDFASTLAGFDKSGLAEEFDDKLSMQPEDRPEEGGFYQKSSFFDNISCDALDREEQVEGQRRGKGFADMRKLDMETFGETFGRNHFRHRGKGSGGGGGNQGGGKGGGGGRNRNNRRRGGGGKGGGGGGYGGGGGGQGAQNR